MNTLAQLGAQRSPLGMAQLATMGQRYQNMPPATFDQRFGFGQAPGPTPDSRDQLRRLFEEQQLRNTPGGIVPGTKTWPYGYTQTSMPMSPRRFLEGPVDRAPGNPEAPWAERLPQEQEGPGNVRDSIPPNVLMQLQGYPAGTIVGNGNPDWRFIKTPEELPGASEMARPWDYGI